MKIEQLKQIVALSKTRSISEAAANLYISQPNLSISIRNLEEELGTQLLIRSNRGVILTTQGERIAEYAQSILSQIERLKSMCLLSGNQTRARLSLANMRFRFAVDAASALYRRYQSMPIDLHIREADRDGVVNLVAKGDCEIGIINILSCYKRDVLKQIKAKNVQYYRLTSNACSVVVGAGNPLYDEPEEREITVDMLRQYPQVRYAEMDYGRYSNKSELVGISGSAGEIVVDSRAAMFELLEKTNAFMIASTNHAAYHHCDYYPRARSFPLRDPSQEVELGWLHQAEKSPSPLALEYIQILSQYFETPINNTYSCDNRNS